MYLTLSFGGLCRNQSINQVSGIGAFLKKAKNKFKFLLTGSIKTGSMVLPLLDMSKNTNKFPL